MHNKRRRLLFALPRRINLHNNNNNAGRHSSRRFRFISFYSRGGIMACEFLNSFWAALCILFWPSGERAQSNGIKRSQQRAALWEKRERSEFVMCTRLCPRCNATTLLAAAVCHQEFRCSRFSHVEFLNIKTPHWHTHKSILMPHKLNKIGSKN